MNRASYNLPMGLSFHFLSFFFSWREEDTQPLNKSYHFCVSNSSASLSIGSVNLRGNSLSQQPFENHWPKEMPALEIVGPCTLAAWPSSSRVPFHVVSLVSAFKGAFFCLSSETYKHAPRTTKTIPLLQSWAEPNTAGEVDFTRKASLQRPMPPHATPCHLALKGFS